MTVSNKNLPTLSNSVHEGKLFFERKKKGFFVKKQKMLSAGDEVHGEEKRKICLKNPRQKCFFHPNSCPLLRFSTVI